MPRDKHDSGVVAVEFALILPLLMLVFFLLVDFGRFFYVATSLNGASQDAARASSLALTDVQINSLVGNYLSPARRVSSASTTPSAFTIVRSVCGGEPKTTTVTVTMSTFSWITPIYLLERFSGSAGSRTRTISATGVRLCT